MWYLVLFFLLYAVSAYEKDITFTVQAGKTDCFYYSVLPDQVIDVEYQVIDSTHGELDVSFQLADPIGRILVADYKKLENSHRHTAQVHGDYRFCFDNTFSTFSQKTVFFDVMINGADSDERDYDDDKEMELGDGAQSYMVKVQDISESVSRVKEHINTARRLQELLSAHEARDRNLAEEMCTRVMRWSLIQIMMMLAIGLMQSKPGEVTRAVMDAIDIGYRHIDCAHVYCNEPEVGAALTAKIEEGVIKREDIFITSKLWCTYHREDLVEGAIRATLKNLNLEYLDLYLIHWPQAYKEGDELFPKDESGKVIYSDAEITETWRGMEHVAKLGLAKSIGVSNFNRRQIEEILSMATIKPVTNQIEVHPYLNQQKLIEFCKSVDMVVTAYSPLGSPDRPWAKPGEPLLMEDQRIVQVAKKYQKTPVQILISDRSVSCPDHCKVVVRFCIDPGERCVLWYAIERGLIVIPKSVTRHRIESNFHVFDFKLTPEDLEVISSLECNGRVCAMEDSDHKDYPFHDEY